MRIYKYEESDYEGDLDDVVFQNERLEAKISERKYLDMTDRELLRTALAICKKLRSNYENK